MNQREKFEAWVSKEYPGLFIDYAPLMGFYKGDDGERIGDLRDAWNAALAASGGNAATRLTDEQILEIQVQHIPRHGWSTNGIAFARAIEAASAPNAALVAALQKAQEDINWMLNSRKFLNGHVFDYIDAALSAAGQEVGK